MRLLYLAAIRVPTEKAHGLQIIKTCEALGAQGVDVELMVPKRETQITEDAFSYYEARRSFSLTALSVPDLVRFGFLGFLITLVWFSQAAKWTKEFWDADILYSRDAVLLFNYLLLGRPLVYEAHNNPSLISGIVARSARKVITISEGLRRAYIALGVSAEKVIVVPDAVDPTIFDSRKESLHTREHSVALYAGKIEKEKGADTFAASSTFLPPTITPVIVGEGNLKPLLKKQYPKVVFQDGTPYNQLPELLHTADVLVLPNSGRFLESSRNTSPLKLFAYMASGIPIVASDVPAIREVLSDETAVFVTPDDAKALAEGVKVALSAQEKGLRAKELVKKYSWHERAKRIITAVSS